MDATDFNLAEAISLTDASHLMRGRGGKGPAVETVRKWCNPRRGCFPAGKDGPRLVMRSLKINGEVVTTRAWVAEFERERVRLGARQVAEVLPIPTPKQRKKQQERNAKALDEAGI
jgi:hypothetical protein